MLAGADITPGVLNNTNAVVDPTPTDDTNLGYSRGSIWINTLTNSVFLCADNSAGAAVWVSAQELLWQESEFTATAGQITFIVPSPPTDISSIEFYVNGVLADRDLQYTASGATFTWLNVSYVLIAGDFIQIRYK